jgi:hypothetical protein
LIDVESQLKKLQSTILDPQVLNWVMQGGARGVRERILRIDYGVIRSVVDRVPLLNAVVKTRVNQVLPFSQYVTEDEAKDGMKGFHFVLKRGDKLDEQEVDQLREFIEQTGVIYSSDREDDFSDYLQMVVREIGTIDQIATELQYNLEGDVTAFRLLDGATVKRVADDYPKKNVKFVQVVDSKLIEEFNDNNLLFDYKNKRVDIRYRGYGYSDVEMCIDLITTLLFGYNHLRDQFVRDKIPRGFISVMGDIDPAGISSIQQYWYSAMSGAGGQWAIPILPSGKDGVGIEFKSLSTSNRDMEYHRGMMFLSSIIAAVFSIDLAELGIKAEDASSVIGANEVGPRVESSKDRGLTSLLMFISQHMNKVLRKTLWSDKYRFAFTGVEPRDQVRAVSILKDRLATDLTINDILRRDGRKERDERWANIILNPHVVQMELQQQNAMQSSEEEYSWEDNTETPEEPAYENENTESESEEEEDITKSLHVEDIETWDDWQKAFDIRTKALERNTK